MPYPFANKHKAEAFVLQCIDFRFRKQNIEFLEKELGLRDLDLVSLAGASKALTDSDTQATVLKQLQISSDLHHIDKIVMIDHLNCGAYGGDESKEDHVVNLNKARKLLQGKFKQEIILVFADLKDNQVIYEII